MKKLQYKWSDGDEWVDYDENADTMNVDDFDMGVVYTVQWRVVIENGDSSDA